MNVHNNIRWFALTVVCALALGVLLFRHQATAPAPVSLQVPEGFTAITYATGVPGARMMVFDSKGRLLVSQPSLGQVLVLEDSDQTGTPQNRRVLIRDLSDPNGLAFYVDPKSRLTYLYISTDTEVRRYLYDVTRGVIADTTGQNIATFKSDGKQHLRSTIAFGPKLRDFDIISGGRAPAGIAGETKLYIALEASCDACLESSWKRGAILESDPEGTYTAEFAGGLHDTGFLAFHPVTKELWATEVGRGGLGDALPPDEVNIIRAGKKYGWPFCYGQRVTDSTFRALDDSRPDIPRVCAQTELPVIEIPAHSEPYGLAFITSTEWPSGWRNDLLVAYHGSSATSGPRIVRFDVDQKGSVSTQEDFVEGWGSESEIYGQPVDLVFDNAGGLMISDDRAGVIYRVFPR